MSSLSQAAPHLFPLLVAYQFLFYVVVITILLNVIFGIIIDTFGELRQERGSKKAHMEGTCFICGIDRFTFDSKGGGFDRHVKNDHNMWSYLYMVVHLREKEPTEYNGWEQHVASCIARDDTSFFPRNTAIVLREHREREAAEGRQAQLRACARACGPRTRP